MDMRIGVIGAGVSGLVAAWLLGEEHEVVIFDRRGYVGGHAHTITALRGGARIPVDTGFQHFSRPMYPAFLGLLDMLGVRPTPARVYANFWSKAAGGTLKFPPPLAWSSLPLARSPSALATLVQLWHAIRSSGPLEDRGDWSVTVGDFVERLRVSKSFKARVLYPFLSAALGTSFEETPKMSARAAMKYPLQYYRSQNPLLPWEFLQIEGGVVTYVDALLRTLGAVEVRKDAAIASVEKCGGRFVVRERAGAQHAFDRLVIAAPAFDAAELVGRLAGAGRLASTLRELRYMPTTIAVHGDARYMPPSRASWSAVNMIDDGRSCEFTMWPGMKRGVDLFKSWISHRGTKPEGPHELFTYHHPCMTPAYFRAQAALAEHQGQGGLWFAGSYTRDIDSHESGVRSALEVASRLLGPRPRPRTRLAGLESRWGKRR
jgi:uncharacterized protein